MNEDAGLGAVALLFSVYGSDTAECCWLSAGGIEEVSLLDCFPLARGRHMSRVRSITSPAIASKADEYRSLLNRDSLTTNSANSSSRSLSDFAAASLSVNLRCLSIDESAKGSDTEIGSGTGLGRANRAFEGVEGAYAIAASRDACAGCEMDLSILWLIDPDNAGDLGPLIDLGDRGVAEEPDAGPGDTSPDLEGREVSRTGEKGGKEAVDLVEMVRGFFPPCLGVELDPDEDPLSPCSC